MASEKFNVETDVVVIGYGAAGAVSAITAHDNGASVIILEKMPNGGGNSRVCGGNIIVPRSIEFAKYLNTLTFGVTEPEIIELFVKEAMKNGDWLKEMGGEIHIFKPLAVRYPMTYGGAGFPHVPNSEYMDKWNVSGDPKDPATKGNPKDPPARRLWALLSSNVARRGIKVMTSTPAKELIKNEKGEIIGVIAETGGKEISIKAKRAVILTCGGYENDQALKWDTLPCKPVLFIGNPGNTGDGIRMAQMTGAALWHMSCLSCPMGFKAPEYESAFTIGFYHPAFILVDKHGRRFVDEIGIEVHSYWKILSHFDDELIEFPRIPFYAIFDDETRRKGPLNASTSGYNTDLYKWSLDNSEEIKKGWIIQAKSTAELAKKTSIEESNLKDTFAKYDQYCKTGKDADLGRAKENLTPIKGPPYYAIKLYPALLNTQGGPRRNIESKVLNAFGKPIPRLYSAGEIGSIWGYLYQGANNLGECIVFGRIAGKNAAAEKPWS